MLPIVNGPLASQILTEALTCLRDLDTGEGCRQLLNALVPYLTPSAIEMLLGHVLRPPTRIESGRGCGRGHGMHG
jgi:hypothetical protein